MAVGKALSLQNMQMALSNIGSTRMVCSTVTEFANPLIGQCIMENLKIAAVKVMDS